MSNSKGQIAARTIARDLHLDAGKECSLGLALDVWLERELAALTAERDALKSLLDSQHNLLRHAEADLSASQQEAQRLREANVFANEKIRTLAKPAVQNLLAKMSTPAPK